MDRFLILDSVALGDVHTIQGLDDQAPDASQLYCLVKLLFVGVMGVDPMFH